MPKWLGRIHEMFNLQPLGAATARLSLGPYFMAQSATVRKEDFRDENFSTGENFADLFENSAAGKLSEGSVVKGTIVGI
jgi:hypothetical protein